jgi:hypothetical protein
VAVSGSQDALESGSDTAGLTGTVAVEGALAASETGQDTAEIREAAPVVAEEPRRGGPALRYSRRDRIAEYLEVRRQRRTRKRTLDELLEELEPQDPIKRPVHGSEAETGPIVSSPRSRSGDEERDRALERAADLLGPSAQRIAAAAAEKAADVITEDRKAPPRG